ncbi:acetyltransferase [Paenibacillus sp. J31TS4]|uniref:GNAT family N-acetyltransferase n=1 Tax=Paenibacillus sp. J31TS4 TaxID=2807195 RepID=UPI001B061AB3|nr:GNAT family N-acetyltransferase [Paenibacillus sp. J31TS4]GIP40725.1 acetyltransferase [Paenibacillus sp. J31TS4]
MEPKVWLQKPDIRYRDAYQAFYEEWKRSGEPMVPWVIGKDPSEFEAMIAWLGSREYAENLPEGWVPDSTFWLVDEQGSVLGAVNIRHRLTDKLLSSGGHIGYGIRPSARGQGLATRLLALALGEAGQLGIKRALVVCDAGNIPSEKTILRNGGVSDADHTEEDGTVIKRYWIDLGPLA